MLTTLLITVMVITVSEAINEQIPDLAVSFKRHALLRQCYSVKDFMLMVLDIVTVSHMSQHEA